VPGQSDRSARSRPDPARDPSLGPGPTGRARALRPRTFGRDRTAVEREIAADRRSAGARARSSGRSGGRVEGRDLGPAPRQRGFSQHSQGRARAPGSGKVSRNPWLAPSDPAGTSPSGTRDRWRPGSGGGTARSRPARRTPTRDSEHGVGHRGRPPSRVARHPRLAGAAARSDAATSSNARRPGLRDCRAAVGSRRRRHGGLAMAPKACPRRTNSR
jgi:hypothetical protein